TKWEVYVQRFLSPGGKWQISSNGGKQPQWSHDGKELFYVAADQKLMAVAVRSGLSLDPGTPNNFSNSMEQAISSVVPMTSVSMASDSSQALWLERKPRRR